MFHLFCNISSEYLHSFAGVITATASLDREINKEYKFRVFVADSGTPRLTSAAKVLITILDMDDERPIFNVDIYSYHVIEQSPPGKHLE